MNKKGHTLKKTYPFLLVILGAIGLIMSFIIMTEKLTLLQDPNYKPPCNINPVISCGTVMKTAQAAAFGFPNPFIGLIGFSIIITIGMAFFAEFTLKHPFKKWFWLGLEAGTLLGVLFVHWLFFQSVYVIGALCPLCMVVWAVTIALFLYTTVYNVREGYIKMPKVLWGVTDIFQRYHASILLVWYLSICSAILVHFWSYWSTLL
jgi:uncharacterized membrane protein